jgi:hypothetical protein
MRVPLGEAAAQIDLQACRGLVAVFGVLGEELENDRVDDGRQSGRTCTRRRWLPGDMAMDPLHGIGGVEGQLTGEELVEGDPERVEVASGVDRAVHAAGLFRRHIGERAGDHLGWRQRRALASQPGGDAESGQTHVARCVDQHVCRLDVSVDQAVSVHLAHRPREIGGERQKASGIQAPTLRPRQNAIERLGPAVFEHE